MSESNFWNDERVEDFFIKLSNQKFYHFGIKTYIDEYKKSKSEHKDYEIQCIQKGGKNYWVQKDGLYVSDLFGQHLPDSWFLANGGIIHSVKRNDGEVFSVKDNVSAVDYEKLEITGFYIADKYLMVQRRPAPDMPISEISKVKQPIPLFTTEDGVEIFEKDEYCIVMTEEGYGFEPYTFAFYTHGDIKKANCYSHCKTFSSRAKANEYILLNKPCLSLKDIEDSILEYHGENYKGLFKIEIEKLRELAKSKV